MNTENNSVLGEESEDDFDWEEVEVTQAFAFEDALPSSSTTPIPNVHDYYGDMQDQDEGTSEQPHLEITIKTMGKRKDPKCVITILRALDEPNKPLSYDQEK